ncbi:hypothetical protein IQ266_16935 [filamentous cyanobacterium LEGE 11480]|uniref:Uncharacterized protein n=1 Tax=Romeriopsis navalis LEGE 11480 TaxID=2777977 RepID=A0A928VR47_9CYAN|nr:hypothetical protein [Romeriopsis navalis]MBE9031421.1 hypothetical protein [Romeriopsis navalis LEGE 11480]
MNQENFDRLQSSAAPDQLPADDQRDRTSQAMKNFQQGLGNLHGEQVQLRQKVQWLQGSLLIAVMAMTTSGIWLGLNFNSLQSRLSQPSTDNAQTTIGQNDSVGELADQFKDLESQIKQVLDANKTFQSQLSEVKAELAQRQKELGLLTEAVRTRITTMPTTSPTAQPDASPPVEPAVSPSPATSPSS